MKICDSKTVILFSELYPGETFMLSGDYYIKTKTFPETDINAVRLTDGAAKAFEHNQNVTREKMKAVPYVEE